MCTRFISEEISGGSVPTAVLGHRIVCDGDSSLYLIGGWKSGYVRDNFVRQVWKYNLSTKRWKQLRSDRAPVSLANHTVCRLDDSRLLVYGGSLLGRENRGNNNETFLYDVHRERWDKLDTSGDACPQASRHWFGQAMQRSGSDVFVATGRRLGSSPESSSLLIHKLDLNTLRWTYLSSPSSEPEGRVRHEMIAYDRGLLIFGGAHCSFETTCSLNVLPRFDTASNSWSTVQTIPDPSHGYPSSRTCHSCVQYGDYVYVCGGYFIPSGDEEQSSRSFDDLWKFHLPTMKWSLLPVHLPGTLWSHAADVTTDGRMYVFGGCTKSTAKERLDRLISVYLETPKLERFCWDVITSDLNTIDVNGLSSQYLRMLSD